MTNRKMLRQTLAVTPVILIALVFGLGGGWVAPILSQLKDSNSEYSLTAEECSWIASLHYFTRGIGPLFAAAIIDKVGRNRIIVTIALLIFLMWILILSTRAVLGIYISRLIYGFAMGMHETTVSIYIGETCSPGIRGRVSGLVTTFFYAGELIVFILAAYVSYDNVAIVHAGLSLVTVISTFLLKEPVQFLIMKGNMQQAERNFSWLQDTEDANLNFEEIKRNVLEERSKTSFAEVFNNRVVFKSFRIVVIITFLSLATGFSAVNSFVTMALSKSKYLTSYEFTTVFGLVQLITCCISSYVMDKFNRRTLMLTGSATIAITQAGTAALYYAQRVSDVPYFDWILFAVLTAYSCFFAMSVYPLCTAIRGELLPQSAKGIGSCLAVVAGSAAGFEVARVFLPIAESYGMETNFIIFSACSLLLFVYAYFDLPETRGKSLVEIQKDLQKMQKADVDVGS